MFRKLQLTVYVDAPYKTAPHKFLQTDTPHIIYHILLITQE